MKIGKIEVGKGKPVFIVAEAGINHNGDMEIAKQLVDVAIGAGADAVKFQTFKKEDLPELPFKNISYDATLRLSEYCKKKDILFFSTPYSNSAVDLLEPIVPVYKLASAHIVNKEFVQYVNAKKKPIIASVGSMKNPDGLAYFQEINDFLTWVKAQDIILLHCVSKYPYNGFSAKYFTKLMMDYPDIPFGFSSHSKQIGYSLDAVKYGACIIEHHITVDDDFDCPDKEVSIDPDTLKELVIECKR